MVPGCVILLFLTPIKTVLKNLQKKARLWKTWTGFRDRMPWKKVDYLNVNSFFPSMEGQLRCEGIKLANQNLKVIGFAGDGDAYGEGIEHLIFAAKRNVDITMIIHNNRVYGLTTGQSSPTSPLGYKGRSTPKGSIEIPLNPLEVMLSSGATFLARGYSRNIELLKTSLGSN